MITETELTSKEEGEDKESSSEEGPLMAIEAPEDSRTEALIDREEDVEDDSKKSNLLGAAFNVSNAALGAGILMFPLLFSQMGLIPGLISFVVAIILMGSTLHILAMAAARTKKPNYQEVLDHLCGRNARYCINCTMGVYLFGCCASYLVVFGDMICAVFPGASRFWVITCCALAASPPMMLKDISALAKASSFGVTVNFFVALIMMVVSANQWAETGTQCSLWKPMEFRAFGTAFATYCFGLQCHLVFIPVFHSLKQASVRRMDYVIAFAYTNCFFLYMFVGVLGYCAYGDDVKSDFMEMPQMPTNFWTSAARVGLAIKSFVAYPLLHFPARLCLGDLALQGEPINDNQKAFYGLTLMFLIFTWLIAVTVKDLAQVIDFSSALLGIFQVFIWPALLLVRMKRGSKFSKSMFLIYCTLGALVTIFGLYAVFVPLKPTLAIY